jgi:hypothetical protein
LNAFSPCHVEEGGSGVSELLAEVQIGTRVLKIKNGEGKK